MTGPDRDRARDLRGYAIGYGIALILTAAAFAVVRWPVLGGGATFAVVLALALIQLVVQLRYFLHLTLARSARDDLQLVAFAVVIVALMVGGTLVILFNLRARMM